MITNIKPLNKEIKKGLYLVPTPIGNLGDITLRSIEILKKSDYILCEDTRVSRYLLEKYEINSKLISYHKFNEKKTLSKIIDLLKTNIVISMISDAGTPSISDPGAILIKECKNHDINIIPLPGPSAVTAAVSISGFSEKFLFYGFFPDKKKILIDDLKHLSQMNCSLVFFVSPKKINKFIPIIKEIFFDRDFLICREISKIYEEYIRGQIADLKIFEKEPKGEITLIISEGKVNKKKLQNLDESDKKNIKKIINKISIKEIINLINKNKEISNKEIYDFCLRLKNEK